MARTLLLEVHLAGGPSLEKRRLANERLAAAIDEARGEPGPSHSPPELTAAFMVAAIESSATSALAAAEPCRFAAAVPELARLVVGAYFGEEAAEEELVALQATA